MTGGSLRPKSKPALVAVAALAAASAGALAPAASAERAVALSSDEPPSLVQFDTATPQERTQRVYVRGLEHREDLLAIDYRPETDRLLGLSDRGRIYRINPETGQARSHPRNAIQSNLGRRVAGFDVNPMADRLRVQTLAGRNFQINPDNPNGPEGTIEDGRLSYADGDRFAGRPPRIAAGAYTDNVDGSTTSRLYGIDARLDTFALQDPADAGVLTTVGGLGLDTVPGETAFDVSGDTGAAFAVVSGFRGPSRLARIDLVTGQATPVGTIGAGGRYEGLAILPRDYANGATRSNDSRKPTFRFATFNASLNRLSEGELNEQLATGDNPQIQAVAETIQRARPDVLLVNELDFDDDGPNGSSLAAQRFQDNYLSVSQNGAKPIFFPERFVRPSNTGIASSQDLNNDGSVVTQPGAPGYGDDALGFGAFPGQFAMAVFSRLPIDEANARTFQTFLWKDMPGNRLPDDVSTPEPQDFYSSDERDIFRLSSKSHWDVPIIVGRETVHFLTSHPTPPVFDGTEDRNGRRNADEIRLFADYITPGAADYLYDDDGKTGGLAAGDRFVVAGDQNSDPLDGDSIPGAIQQLLDNPRVNTAATPRSDGGPEQAAVQGRANTTHRSDPAFDTADFADGAPGNLRADYVLPDSATQITNAFVFWPPSTGPLFRLPGTFLASRANPGNAFNGFPASDHRLVAVDIVKP